jgi:hypothetical protein
MLQFIVKHLAYIIIFSKKKRLQLVKLDFFIFLYYTVLIKKKFYKANSKPNIIIQEL